MVFGIGPGVARVGRGCLGFGQLFISLVTSGSSLLVRKTATKNHQQTKIWAILTMTDGRP
jgi:hypothetical protein